MSTGITVADSVVAKFDQFKLKKAGDVKYIEMVIAGTEVVLGEELPKSTPYDEFLQKLDPAKPVGIGDQPDQQKLSPANLRDRPCYWLVDHDYMTTDGRDADKIVLISWIPDTAKVKLKMVTSGTKEAVKSALMGVAININATDMSECTLEVLNAQCTKI